MVLHSENSRYNGLIGVTTGFSASPLGGQKLHSIPLIERGIATSPDGDPKALSS